eukprot:2256919-Rhodomonas_salina.2
MSSTIPFVHDGPAARRRVRPTWQVASVTVTVTVLPGRAGTHRQSLGDGQLRLECQWTCRGTQPESPPNESEVLQHQNLNFQVQSRNCFVGSKQT